ncbi:MAG: radical SAM protein, partial [Candidatus Omnitrophica bacterium]|nr:radical SAM protein [Candidatus Omnitrophota bacterium]
MMLKGLSFPIKKKHLRKARDFLHRSMPYRVAYRFAHLKTSLFDHVLIQTNNRCTRKCPFCWYGIKDVAIPDHEMPQGLFYKIIDDLAAMDYSGRVSLFEMNEPLTDKRIFEWVSYVKQRLPRSWQMLATNGDLLTEDKAIKLFESGIDYLNVNSYSDSDYAKMKLLISQLPGKISKRILNDRLTTKDMSDNRGGNLPVVEVVKKALKEPCSRVNHILYIKPDGNVVSCF